MNRLGILLSGRGSNFLAIADAIANEKLEAEIAVVLSDRSDAPGLALAHSRGIPAFAVSGPDRDQSLVDHLETRGVELVCLAGYMRLLGPGFVARFRNRILNIHPSLLPAFPGLESQHQALAHGVKFTGCTVHFVDEGLDSGPIIRQAVVPVLPEDTDDTLSARILKEEHRIYTEAIALIISGRYRIAGRTVVES